MDNDDDADDDDDDDDADDDKQIQKQSNETNNTPTLGAEQIATSIDSLKTKTIS